MEETATVYEGLETTRQESKPDYQELAAIKTNENLTSIEVVCFVFIRWHTHMNPHIHLMDCHLIPHTQNVTRTNS